MGFMYEFPNSREFDSDLREIIELVKNVETSLEKYVGSIKVVIKNVKAYGAVGDGVTDDSHAIQTAINEAKLINNSIVFFPDGIYAVGNQLNITDGITLVGSGWGSVSKNPNTSGGGSVTIRAISGMDSIFNIKAVNNIVFNAKIYGMTIDGALRVSNCVKMTDVSHCRLIDLQLRDAVNDAILITTEKYLSAFNEVTDCSIVFTNGDGNGIHLDGTDTAQVTQTFLSNITMLTTNDGKGLFIEHSDNNYGTRIQHVSSSGYGLYLGEKATNNTFSYLSTKVFAHASTFGNKIDKLCSEGSGVVLENGAKLIYNLVDYVNGKPYETDKFKLTDYLYIPAGSFAPFNGATYGTFTGFNHAALLLALNNKCGVSLMNKHWDDGVITKIDVYIGTDSGNGKIDLITKLSAAPNLGINQSIVEKRDGYQIHGNGINNIISIPYNIAVKKNDWIMLELERGVAYDTIPNATACIIGVGVEYIGSGAHSAGSGNYDATPITAY